MCEITVAPRKDGECKTQALPKRAKSSKYLHKSTPRKLVSCIYENSQVSSLKMLSLLLLLIQVGNEAAFFEYQTDLDSSDTRYPA